MALFKIFKGRKANLPQTKTDGYAYFTTDDGKFYIDSAGQGEQIANRTCINPTMVGASAEEAGKEGMVPPAGTTDRDKFLRGDGIWSSIGEYYTKTEIDEIVKDLRGGGPALFGVTDVTVELESTFDPMENVQAIDGYNSESNFVVTNNDITDSITIEGTVNTSVEGEYILTYSVTGKYGYTVTQTRKVTVEKEWDINDYATVLFEDGHFMINEKKSNREADVAIHGAVTNEYIPWDKNNPDTSYVFTAVSQRPWNDQITNIKTVSTGSSFKPRSTAYMFMSCSNLTTFDVSNWDTSALTNALFMFRGCSSLMTLDVSNWNTSALTNASSMFGACTNLMTLDVSSWNTSALTNAREMFVSCSNLTILDVMNWDTGVLTNAMHMFANCSRLTTLDMSNWNTSALTNTNNMFSNCADLTTIFASDRFVTSQITNSIDMFRNCPSLVGGAGTTYSISYTGKTYARIDNPPDAPGYFTAKS